MQSTPVTQKKPRYGLMKVRVESNHVIRIGEGKHARKQQVTARAISRFPDAEVKWICTWCRDHGVVEHAFPTAEALIAAHPTKAVMTKQEEAHLYHAWSDTPEDDEAAERIDAQLAKIPKDERESAKHKAVVDALLKERRALKPIGMLTEDDEE